MMVEHIKRGIVRNQLASHGRAILISCEVQCGAAFGIQCRGCDAAMQKGHDQIEVAIA